MSKGNMTVTKNLRQSRVPEGERSEFSKGAGVRTNQPSGSRRCAPHQHGSYMLRSFTPSLTGKGLGVRFACPGIFSFLFLFLLSACNDPSSSTEIYLAADPPSISEGLTLSVMLTASEDFFSGDVEAPVTSEGGLVLQSVEVQDNFTALATFSATTSTQPGLHSLELTAGGETALLKMSVIVPQPGVGEVSSENATATAGANGATLAITGSGTHFDSACQVHVEGADGFHVSMIDVVGNGLINVTYDIDMDQKPTVCTVVVTDGMEQYEVPFTILSPAHFDTQVDDQWLTKGQEGWIVLSHPDANMHFGTDFQIDDETIETGSVDVISETEIRIPVRVPFDYLGDELTLTAWTYNEGGAFLETMDVEFALFTPAYIGFVPSRLDMDVTDHSVEMVGSGVDLLDIESLTIEKNDELFISDWASVSSDSLTVDFAITSQATPGAFEITVNDGFRDLTALVATTSLGSDTIYGDSGFIKQGDRVYFPVILSSATVTVDTTAMADDDIEVHGIELVDEGCVAVDLQVAKDATEGLHTLTVNNEGDAYYVYVKVSESEI